MHPDFQRLLQDATRLTRSGNLQAATAAIRAALRGKAPSAAEAGEEEARNGDLLIDVDARELTPSPGERQDAPSAPGGPGRFVAGHSGNATHGRDYKLYIPPQADEGAPLPLVVMLHGCTQDPDDFAAGTGMNELARVEGCYVLYPAQSAKANPQRCWNWFKHTHQARGRGEPAMLADMTREVMAQHTVDPARVYVAGLSAGGAMAAIMVDTYPDLYAAAGVHSGLAAGAAQDLPSAMGAMRSGSAGAPTASSARPVIVFHGDADTTVHPGNGGHVVDASVGEPRAPVADRQRAEGGRHYTRWVHRGADGAVLAEH
ncbi:MAG: Esterase, depolymerase [Ramlibacter sp.]|nr:Esterase, depolymerase [Ramlibacter sp.]